MIPKPPIVVNTKGPIIHPVYSIPLESEEQGERPEGGLRKAVRAVILKARRGKQASKEVSE